LKYESKETFQDNEAIQSTPMVMSYPHYFGLSSRINKFIFTNILSPSTPHTNSMHVSHLVCYFPLKSLHQFYVSYGRFYDKIESWSDGSYSTNVPINYYYHLFNMVNRFFGVLIFPTFCLSLLQILLLIFCHKHLFLGLGLHGWLHCHYDFT
jgi:hypothetical protein